MKQPRYQVKIVVGVNYHGSSGRIAIRASNSAELSGVRGFETPSAPDEIRGHVKKFIPQAEAVS